MKMDLKQTALLASMPLTISFSTALKARASGEELVKLHRIPRPSLYKSDHLVLEIMPTVSKQDGRR